MIDIVLGFLSSGTGSPSMSFGDYVKKTLKMHVTRRTLPKVSLTYLPHSMFNMEYQNIIIYMYVASMYELFLHNWN